MIIPDNLGSTERTEAVRGGLENPPMAIMRGGSQAAWDTLRTDPDVLTWSLNAAMEVSWCSPQAARALADRPESELIGQPLSALAPPEVVERMRRIAALLQEERRPVLGSALWRGRRMRSWFCPIWDQEGERLEHVLVFTRAAPLNVPDDPRVVEADYAHLGEFAPLTRREVEVLAYLGMGLTIDEIAERLHRSVKTVKRFREGIAAKLGVGDRTSLTLRARDAGLTPRHASLARLN